MNNIFFCSDLHLGHEAIIKYCNRPFKNAIEMNECIIDNFNSVVGKKDMVFCLGDFCFHKPIQYLKALNGEWCLIVGNHDARQGLEAFKSVKDTFQLKNIIPNFHIFMSHYGHRVWPQSHYWSGHIFGHSHGKLEPYGRSFDVGVDTNNFMPYSIEDVLLKMKTLKPIFTVNNVDPLESFGIN